VRHAIDPTMTRLLRDVAAGIRVLHSRDGVTLTESQIAERARNIVMGLVGNYHIQALDAVVDEDASSERSADGGAARFPHGASAAVTGPG